MSNPIEIFHAEGMKCIERDGQVFFTAEEIGEQLGYSDPRISINNLYQRNVQELQDYSSTIKLMTEAGERSARVFTEEGVYIISFLAQTDRAAEFRRRVASLLKWVRQATLSKARLEGAKVALAITPERLRRIKEIVRYREMGLNGAEIAKLVGLGRSALGKTMAQARAMGLLPPADPRMVARARNIGQRSLAARAAKIASGPAGARP